MILLILHRVILDLTCGVMVNAFASSVVDRSWFRAPSSLFRDSTIGNCCFSAKHSVLTSNSMDGFGSELGLYIRVE